MHRNMWSMKMGPTRQSHRFGVGCGRFGGSVEIRGVSGLGDALVGARRWDSGVVLRERDIILGGDVKKAWAAVGNHRLRMKLAWKAGFAEMVELEKGEFGEKSFFVGVEEG